MLRKVGSGEACLNQPVGCIMRHLLNERNKMTEVLLRSAVPAAWYQVGQGGGRSGRGQEKSAAWSKTKRRFLPSTDTLRRPPKGRNEPSTPNIPQSQNFVKARFTISGLSNGPKKPHRGPEPGRGARRRGPAKGRGTPAGGAATRNGPSAPRKPPAGAGGAGGRQGRTRPTREQQPHRAQRPRGAGGKRGGSRNGSPRSPPGPERSGPKRRGRPRPGRR